MSVSLNPRSALGFNRPLSTRAKCSLIITNDNLQPVAFKVRTTSPKLYCVQPNMGRLEPGGSIDVLITLEALKKEPPLDAKCKDKFLIQSTIITPDKENLSLHSIWDMPEVHEEGKVFQQKLHVKYLSAEGQALERDGNAVGTTSNISVEESRYNTVKLPVADNKHKPEAYTSSAFVEEPAPVPKNPIVSLNPSSTLGFNRPLTTLSKQSLIITNTHDEPVLFKIKTTSLKLYCVQPNSGRLEPGESIDVSITMQGLKEEPPLGTKCEDKFLIQSAIITLDKMNRTLNDMWASLETDEKDKIFRQKLRVTYLPDAHDKQHKETARPSLWRSTWRKIKSISNPGAVVDKHSRLDS